MVPVLAMASRKLPSGTYTTGAPRTTIATVMTTCANRSLPILPSFTGEEPCRRVELTGVDTVLLTEIVTMGTTCDAVYWFFVPIKSHQNLTVALETVKCFPLSLSIASAM
jgi:hypothetical protein